MDTYENAPPQGLIRDEAQAISASNRPGNNTADPRARRLAEAERFLTTLDAEAESWCFQCFDDSGKRGELARTMHGEIAELFDTLDDLNRRGAGVFVCVNEVEPGAPRKAANVRAIVTAAQSRRRAENAEVRARRGGPA